MFINEFYSKLMSGEGSRLFDALRRVSRLEKQALLAKKGEEPPGWAEWPPIVDEPESAGLMLKKA